MSFTKYQIGLVAILSFIAGIIIGFNSPTIIVVWLLIPASLLALMLLYDVFREAKEKRSSAEQELVKGINEWARQYLSTELTEPNNELEQLVEEFSKTLEKQVETPAAKGNVVHYLDEQTFIVHDKVISDKDYKRWVSIFGKWNRLPTKTEFTDWQLYIKQPNG
jgi:hypothetical protein